MTRNPIDNYATSCPPHVCRIACSGQANFHNTAHKLFTEIRQRQTTKRLDGLIARLRILTATNKNFWILTTYLQWYNDVEQTPEKKIELTDGRHYDLDVVPSDWRTALMTSDWCHMA